MKMRKVLFGILFAVFLLALTAGMAFAANSVRSFSVNAYQAESALEPGAVQWYKKGSAYYLFLPGCADRSNLTVWYDADSVLTFDGEAVPSGAATGAFANDIVNVACGTKTYTVNVLQGETGGVFLTTESGSMDAINADKEHKESGDITIVDGAGKSQYSGALDSIKGRGNSTWTLEKKPYNIKLGKKADIFGMGKAKKWCLLAEHSDESKIRNDLGYAYSRALGNENTSEVYMVDLYCNGVYMGAYSLTEKVEIGENRVDIFDLEGATEDVNEEDLDTYSLGGSQGLRTFNTIKYANIPNDPDEITGGYLLELEKIYRYVDEPSGFISSLGQAVTVKEPEFATKAQVNYIAIQYKRLEEALYSPTGYNTKGKYYTDYIDLDEMAQAYIIQELCENFDGCSSSFYLYKDVGDNRFHFGPTWDLDLSMGRGFENGLISPNLDAGDPSIPYIFSTYIGNHAKTRPSFLAQALNHPDFIAAVKRVWATRGQALAEQMIASIDAKAEANRATVVMDALRWSKFGASNAAAASDGYTAQIEAVKVFLNRRIGLINTLLSADTGFMRYETNGKTVALTTDRTIYLAGQTAVVMAPEASVNANDSFLGWTETPGGKTVQYVPGESVTPGSGKILYAVWGTKEQTDQKRSSLLDAIRNFFARIKAFFDRLANLFK